MAAAVLSGPQKRSVQGDVVYIGYDSITFTTNGDTWQTPLRHIFTIDLTPTTSTAFAFTVSANSEATPQALTFVGTSGQVFRGGVTGEY